MKSGVPWQVSRVRREAREAAREAARRAGMSIGEWLDSVILESAETDDVESRRPAERKYNHYDEEFTGREHEARPRRSRYAEYDEQRLPLAHGEDVPAIHRGFAELNQRFDDLTRQLSQVAAMTAAKAARPDQRNEEPSHQLVEVISKLDRRLDQLIAEGRFSKTDIEQRVNAVDRAIADTLRDDIVFHVASKDALAGLSDEVRALAGKVDRAAANSGSDSALNALGERIAALADALAARNQVGQSVPNELEAVIKGLVDKIERVQLTRGDHAALGHLEDRIAKLVEKLDASDARLNHLEAIERGLAELLIHLEHQRVPNPARAQSSPVEVDELSRDVADLRQTGKKAQESLELVHGTLGHVVDPLVVNGPPPSPPLAEAPKLIEFALTEPSKRAEAPGAERRSIDPTLPPDHPLEPGSGGSRRGHPGSPADRIAASESGLVGAKPLSDPGGNSSGGKSNFIAAARRAAQAAGREAPVNSAASGPREIASAAGKLASRVGKLRALIGGTTAIVIVLGGLQIANTFLGSPQEAGMSSPEGQSQTIVATPERPADAATPTPADVNQAAPASSEPASPRPASSEPAAGRQSAVFPASGGMPSPLPGSGIMIPLDIAGQDAGAAIAQPTRSAAPAAEREVTGSISTPAVSTSTKPTTAPVSAASTPSMPAPAPPPAQPTSAALPAGSDKLPATFGMSLRAAAAQGDASAQYEIAQRYAEGRGVAQNLTDAVQWFERAAKQGLVPAQFRLGGLYEKGLGVKKNFETARRFYIAAGEAGNAEALHHLAVLYAKGIDGKPDYQTAARWFRKAADYGVTDSQYNLAILYARGIGVEQNLAEAYKWFALAAQDGDLDSAKKRDDLGARLDRHSLNAALQAIQNWGPQQQPEAAVQVKTPPGGWDQAASSPIVPPKREPPLVGPKLDLATSRLGQ
jgi:localization factor PodJL